jgi:hypothetical protein
MSASAKRSTKRGDGRLVALDSSTAYHSRVTPITSASSSCVTRFPSRWEARTYGPRSRTWGSIRRRRNLRTNASSERRLAPLGNGILLSTPAIHTLGLPRRHHAAANPTWALSPQGDAAVAERAISLYRNNGWPVLWAFWCNSPTYPRHPMQGTYGTSVDRAAIRSGRLLRFRTPGSTASAVRSHVLVEAKEVCGVVLGLECDQSFVIVPEGGAYHIFALVAEKAQ